MGIRLCSCRAVATSSGSQVITLGIFQVTVNFDVVINICPECSLDSSLVSTSFSANIPIVGSVSASFTGVPTGFPVCFEENGNQVLEVEVAGKFVVNGGDPDPTTFNLTINSSGQVCIDLSIGPMEIPYLTVPVVFESCS